MMTRLSSITGTQVQESMVNNNAVSERENQIMFLKSKPLLTVDEVRRFLELPKNKAYALVNENPPFKVTKIGGRKYIHSESFFKWINGVA